MNSEFAKSQPPYSIEVEKVLLWALLLSPSEIHVAIDCDLKKDDFFDRRNAVIFEVILELHKEKIEPEPSTIVNELRKKGKLDIAGGYSYVLSLPDYLPSTVNIDYYISTLKDLSARRKLLDLSAQLQVLINDENLPIEQIKNILKENLSEISTRKKTSLIKHIPSSEEIGRMNVDVEWLVEGLIPKGAITLLFGRGGIGKTWLALQLGKAVAEKSNIPVIYVGFEDPIAILKERLSVLGTSKNLYIWHISNSEIIPPKLDSKDWKNYKNLPQDSLFIFDTLRASQSGDENSSRDMAIIMERLKELREKGFTILLLHHTPKSNEGIYKGSTAILDLVDHALCLEKTKDEENESLDTGVFRLGTKEKTRFEMFEIYLEFDRGFKSTFNPKTEKYIKLCKIIDELGNSVNQKEILEKAEEELGWNRKKTIKILNTGEGKYWTYERKWKEKIYSTKFIKSSNPTLRVELEDLIPNTHKQAISEGGEKLPNPTQNEGENNPKVEQSKKEFDRENNLQESLSEQSSPQIPESKKFEDLIPDDEESYEDF